MIAGIMVPIPAAPRSLAGSSPAGRSEVGGELHLPTFMKQPAAPTDSGSYRWLIAGKILRFLVALLPVPDLLLCAKHLFVEAMVAFVPARTGQR